MVITVATNDMDDVQGPDEKGAGLRRSLRTHPQLSHLLKKEEEKSLVLATPAIQTHKQTHN